MACGRAINPKWWSMWFSWPAILVTVALNSSLVLSTPSLGRCSWCEETQTCFDFSSHICKMTNWDSPILNRNLFFYYSLVVYQFGMCGEWVDVEPKSHIGGWISRVVRHCEVTLGAIPNLWVGTGKSLSSVNGSRNGMRKKAELFQLFGWFGMWLVLLHYTGKIKKFISCFHCFNRFDNQVIVPSCWMTHLGHRRHLL